jgi:hypothetical protein
LHFKGLKIVRIFYWDSIVYGFTNT